MPAASPLSPSLGKRVTHSSVVPVVESPRRTTLPSAAGGARRRSFMETAMGKLGGAAGPGGGSDGVVVSDVGVMYERFMEALRAYKPLSEAREREEVHMCVQCVCVCICVSLSVLVSGHLVSTWVCLCVLVAVMQIRYVGA
jgi:hypothetical protein